MQLALSDLVALALLILGVFCQTFHARFRPGLGTSMFVGLVSVGLALAASRHHGSMTWTSYSLCHVIATLCSLWALFGWLAGTARTSMGAQDSASSGTFFAWSLVWGTAAIVLTLNHFTKLTWERVLDTRGAETIVELAGLWDIAALLVAVLLWAATSTRPQQPVLLLLLAAMAVWWSSLQVDPLAGLAPLAGAGAGVFRPRWWSWIFQLQLGLTTVLIVAAVLQDIRYRSRRRRAWPDRLDDLLEPYSRWPFFIRMEAIIAAVVLVLGVYQIIQFAPPGWPLSIAGGLVCATAGAVCVFMTYRRWSANTAGLGLSLLSLSAVFASCAVTAVTVGPRDAAEYAERIPTLFNAVLFALALMIAWWRWLATVWQQQLLGDIPWTTAGRMIPYNRRTAFFLSALAMLMAFEMALWPNLVAASDADDSAGRMWAGLAAIGLLAGLTIQFGARHRSTTNASLGMALVIAGIVFLFIRMPAPVLRGWIIQYSAVVLGGLALPSLLTAESLGAERWRYLAPPLWLLALLVLPAAALALLLSPERQPAEWVKPATLATLGLVYGLAGRREHRRAFLVLGAVLFIASFTTLYNVYRG